MAKALNVSLAVTADTSQAKAQLQQLQQSLQQLTSSSTNLQLGINSTDIQKASAAALELSAHLKQATNINTGTLDFAKLNNSLIANKKSLSEYGDALLKLGPQGQQAFQQLAQSIAQSEVPTKRLTSLFGEFGTVLKNTIRWQLSSSAIHGFMGAVSTAYHYAQDLNKSLNNIQIVTGASDEKMAKFAESANKAAKALSTSTTAYTDASLIYYQQGLNDKEVAARTETTIKMANITGQSAQKVSDQMTAIWNNFAKGSTNLEYYADVITALGAATASSSEEISTGLEKFAAIADTVGLSYENATAALATITATTRQSADTVGTGLRTLFSRLQSVSLGETLEDGVNLTKYSKALEKVGVSVLDASGELRDMDNILNDLGEKWQSLSKAQQTALAQTVGGVRQYTTLIALMDNFDFYKENIQTAQTSEGTVARQAEIYASSWEGASKRVQAAAQAIYSDLIDDKAFVNILNGFEKVLTFLDRFIDGIGGLKGLLTGLGTIATTVFQKQFTQGIYNAGVKLKEFFTPQSVHLAAREKFLSDAAERAINYETNSGYQIKTRRDLFRSQLDNESTFIARSAMMTPFQQDLGRMYLDAQRQARDNYEKAVQATEKASDIRGDAQATLFTRFRPSNTQPEWLRNFQISELNKQGSHLAASEYQRFNSLGYYQDPRTGQWSYNPQMGQFKAQMARIDKPLQNLDNFNRGLIEGGLTEDNIGKKVGELFDKSFGTDANQNPLAKPEVKERVMGALAEATGTGLENQIKVAQAAMRAEVNAQLDEDVTKMAAEHKDDWTEDDIKAYRETRSAELDAKFKEWQAKTQAEQSGKNAKAFIDNAQAGKNVANVISGVATGAMAFASMTSSIDSMSSSLNGLANGSLEAGEGITQLVSGATSGLMSMGMAFKNLGLWGGIAVTALTALHAVLKRTGLEDKFLDWLNPERAEKRAIETAKKSVEVADNIVGATQERQNNFTAEVENYDDLIAKVNQLSVGTLEYTLAVNEANQSLNKLKETYGDLLNENTDFASDGRLLQSAKDRIEHQLAWETAQAQNRRTLANINVVQAENAHQMGILARTQTRLEKAKENGHNAGLTDAQVHAAEITNVDTQDPIERWLWGDSAGAKIVRFFGLWGAAVNDMQSGGLSGPPSQTSQLQDQVNTRVPSQTIAEASTIIANAESQIDRNYEKQAQQYQKIFTNIGTYNDIYGENNEVLTNIERFTASFLADKYLRYAENGHEDLFYTSNEDKQINTYTRTDGKNITGLDTNVATWDKMNDQALIEAYRDIIGDFNRDLFLNENGAIDREAIITQLRAAQESEVAAEKYAAAVKKMENSEAAKRFKDFEDQQLSIVESNINAINDMQHYRSDITEYDLWYADQIKEKISTAKEGLANIQGIGQEFNDWYKDNADTMTYKDLINSQEMLTSLNKIFNNEEINSLIGKNLFTKDGFNKSFSDALSSMDLSNNIKALFDFKKASIVGPFTQQFSDLFDKVLEDIGGKANLFSQIFHSSEFTESLKEVQKEFKRTGKISIKNVKDIANSCEDLNEALDLNILSIGAVGAALELYSMGAVADISTISDAVWEVLEIINQFTTSLSNAFDYIDEWTNHLDRSTQDLSDHFSKISKDVFELLGEGNVGGERLYQQLTGMFGERYAADMRRFFIDQETGAGTKDNPEARQKNYTERYGEIDKWIQQAQTEGNNRALWEGMLTGAMDQFMQGQVAQRDESGKLILDSEGHIQYSDEQGVSKNLESIGFSLGEGNDIELETYGRTTTQMQAALASAMGIDFDAAGVWLQELAGHSASITQDLKTNDYLSAASQVSQLEGADHDLANLALARTTDQTTLDAAQARLEQQRAEAQRIVENETASDTDRANAEDTLAKIEAQETALKEVQQTHEDIAKDQQTILDNADETTGIYKQLSDTSKEVSQNILNNSKTATTKTPDGKTREREMVDAQQLMDYYQSLGMSAEQAWETTKQAYQNYGDQARDARENVAAFGVTAEDVYGNVKGVALSAQATLEDFNEAQKQLAIDIKHSENQELGKDLFKGMVAAASEMQGQLQEITGIDAVVNLTVDADTSAAQGKISEVVSSAEGTTGTVKIDGDNEGAKTAGDSAATYIDGLNGTVTINGDTGPFESAMSSILNQNYSVNVKVNLTGISSGAIITAATNAARVRYHTKALGGLIQSNAFGSANRSAAPGLSLTAEEGPEVVWNKNDGYAYLVGGNGHPEFVMLRPGDRVFNANQTREILNYNRPDSNYFNSILNPENMDQKLFGSFSEGSAYGSYGPSSRYGHTGGAGGAGKTKDFTPERYHVIKRQIQDLEFWYDELAKAREKAYGTNILEAIDDEIKATDELLKAQQALVKEAEDFKSKDLAKLQELSKKYNFKLELDSNGNITNWDDLQAEYAAAAQNKDETAKEIWDAINQYEESIDEWQADFSKMTDLQLQKAELQLERITEKREMKIEFDEKEIKLLDFYIKRIENSVYNTANTINKTSEKFKFIRDQADAAYESIDSVFEKLVDRSGREVRKADGSAYTLEDWINMSKEERDALDINYDFGKELEEDYDQILDALEQFDELKTDAIDRFSEAFQELDENIENTIGLFDHYKNMLSTLKDIGDLQGVTLAPEMEKVLEQINQNMFDNIQRTIQASQKEYEFIQQQKDKLQKETDKMIERYGKEDERVIAAQKQLEEYENRIRTLEENMVGSWQEGLNLIQDWFNSTMEKIVSDYESSITGMYKTADEFEKAWDQQKSVEDHYVKDYERYYQISKLQRSITKDLENAAKAGNKQNERMKRLYNDLNKAREDGAEVTAYDLDIFAKRYEYEKALMELEEARNAKNEVRLQRDANGNWGYVYTSVGDEDDLAAKQQRVDDTFYELQKRSQDQLASVSDTMMSRMAGIGARLKELYGEGASPERIKEYLDLVQKELNLDREDIEKALRDAGMTADEAKLRYGADGFDILDNFNETLLSSITGNETLDELMEKLGISISETDTSMQSAVDTYNERIKAINSWFEENGETAAEAIGKLATGFDQKSKETLETIPEQIQTAKDILDKAFQSMQDYHTKWDIEVGKIENRLDSILTALHQLNAIEIPGPNPVHMDSGGYTGTWGTSGKIAVLHEKENVFDKYDTLNLLNAANILRTIDLQTNLFSKGLGGIITPWIDNMKSQELEQDVHIEANFPNVQNRHEIEAAFDNLINKASQYANRKNMSAMTFQDMYTSKF